MFLEFETSIFVAYWIEFMGAVKSTSGRRCFRYQESDKSGLKCRGCLGIHVVSPVVS